MHHIALQPVTNCLVHCLKQATSKLNLFQTTKNMWKNAHKEVKA